MSIRTIASRGHAVVFAGALCIAAPAMVFAASPLPPVKVFSDHYEAAGKRFANLDQLEAWVKATGARGLVFHGCMSGPTQPLVAAMERFRNIYLDVRWSLAGEAGCPSEKSMTQAQR